MTKDQLSAIRARLDAATPGPWEAGTACCCPDMGWVDGPKGAVCPQFTATKVTHSLDANDAELIANAPTDLRALLDEVERLKAREESLVKQDVAMMKSIARLQARVEGLTADRYDAFRRGAEAMRELVNDRLEGLNYLAVADEIQAIPIPESR